MLGQPVGRVRDAFKNPDLAVTYLRRSITHTINELRKGNLGRIGAHATYTLFDRDLVTHYFSRKTDNSEVLISVLGNDLIIDTSAPGIEQELLTHQIKEPVATQAYRKELQRIKTESESPTVLEVGANIGYFLLQAADLLGDTAQIYAFEPGENNIEQLRRNVCINGFSEQVDIIQSAVGDETGTTQFRIRAAGNKNQVVDTDTGPDVVDVDLITLDRFAESRGLTPEDIDIVRMDAQGYEYNILQGMETLLRDSNNLLLFVEVHPSMLGDDLDAMIKKLNAHDFEIVSASGGWWFTERPYQMQSLNELSQYTRSVELLLRK